MKAFLTSAPDHLPPAREKSAATTPTAISYTLFLACSWFLLEGLCRCHQAFEHRVPLSQHLQRQKRISPSGGWTGEILHSVNKSGKQSTLLDPPTVFPYNTLRCSHLMVPYDGAKRNSNLVLLFSRVPDTTRTFSSVLCLYLTFRKGSSAHP